jgi:hypothetical protein
MPLLQAQALSFFASAALHEVLVSVPCHTFRLWAFAGMMLQVCVFPFYFTFPEPPLWNVMLAVLQVPLIMLSRFVVRRLQQPVWFASLSAHSNSINVVLSNGRGNVLFWTSFLVFGQPLLVLFYSHDYIRSHLAVAAAANINGTTTLWAAFTCKLTSFFETPVDSVWHLWSLKKWFFSIDPKTTRIVYVILF